MSKIINVSDALVAIPSAFIAGSSSYASASNTNNGLADASSTSYAQFNLTTGSNATTTAIYQFDCSSIPEGATINSVTCQVKCSISTTTANRVSTRQVQLFSGTTAKGTAYSVANSTTAFNVTAGDWTRAELQNARIRLYAVRGTQNATTNYYFRFYGATLSINYTYQEILYEITSTVSTDEVSRIDPEGVTDTNPGETYTLDVYVNSLDNIIVEDNGTDVTSQLVQHTVDQTASLAMVPGSTFTTGFSTSGAQFYIASNTSNTNNLDDPIGHSAESPASQPSSNSWTYVKDGGSNTATGWIIFNFDFSEIPANAIIQSVDVKCYGAKESLSSGSQYKSTVGLYSDTTLKSTEQDFTSSTPYVMTISSPGTWTRAELQNAKLRHTVAYYGGWMGGITWTVKYTLPDSEIIYYYTYTLGNVQADHIISVSENIVIPPDEDPELTYHSLTISSINATTDPGKGTTRVEEGTNQSIVITPFEEQVTLILDNGVDVSSQLVSHGGANPTASVATAPNATYGFAYTASTGYWTSTNKARSQSAAVARVTFDLPVPCLVTFDFINYAEATYDYGIFGNVDTALGTTYTADSNAKRVLSANADNTSAVQTLTYEVPSGSHYIDVKYRKDQATDSNNDNLQFKYTITKLENDEYYTYQLNNITQNHSLVFVFGDVSYYFVSSSTSGNAKLYPDGQMVVLEDDSYRLNIVPENNSDSITIRDNNVDVTNQLERKEIETEKDGQTTTTVNYIYKLSNVRAGHTLVVSSTTTSTSFIKKNGAWVAVSTYVKLDGRWTAVADLTPYLDSNNIYVKASS